MEIIVIIIPKVSAVQCNILDITFFSCSHLNVTHRPGKTADLLLQIPESAFPSVFSGTKHLNNKSQQMPLGPLRYCRPQPLQEASDYTYMY